MIKAPITRLLLLLMIISTLSCQNETKENVDFRNTLQIDIQETLGRGDSVIDLESITDFNWDRLFIFKPYTPIADIDSTLGFKWEEAHSTRIEQSEGVNLLVFVDRGKVISYSRIPRNFGDFVKMDVTKPITRNTRFIVRKEDAGWQEWIFVYVDE